MIHHRWIWSEQHTYHQWTATWLATLPDVPNNIPLLIQSLPQARQGSNMLDLPVATAPCLRPLRVLLANPGPPNPRLVTPWPNNCLQQRVCSPTGSEYPPWTSASAGDLPPAFLTEPGFLGFEPGRSYPNQGMVNHYVRTQLRSTVTKQPKR
jgi:hypothetical protein